MTRFLSITLLAVCLTGCWYWPSGTRRPYGHEPLPDQGVTTPGERRGPSPMRSAEVLVLHRPESSVLQPIGGIYAPALVATIEAPDAPLDVFECLGDSMAAAGLDVRRDYATSSDKATYDASLITKVPMHIRLHVTELRLDALWKAEEKVDRSRMAARVSVTDPRGQVRYSRVHEISAAKEHRSDAPVMCRLGETLASLLASDPAFLDAVGAAR